MPETVIYASVILGVIQGLTEFLPVSSSGHLILAHNLLGFAAESSGLTFDALLHFATALAIVTYFRVDIWNLIVAGVHLPFTLAKKRTLQPSEHFALALLVGTIPAVAFGLLLEDIMATLFRNPLLVAGTLVVGSMVMLSAEKYTGRFSHFVSEQITWRHGVIIGLFQSFALIPGMSRSGMTISGGMLLGLSREMAAKFGFLLGVPVLLGAGSKKALEIGFMGIDAAVISGVIVSFFVALLVIHYLLYFLRTYSLRVFIIYRIMLAIGIVLAVLIS